MRIKKTLFTALLLAASLAVSCAVDPDEDSNAAYDHMMEAWIRVNHPGVKPYGSYGAYVLQMNQGSGSTVPDSAYVRVHYTKRMLDGTIADTNIKELSEQLGTYTVASCYEGNTWRLDQGYLPDALEEVIRAIRAGGQATVALPLSASSHDYTVYDAFKSSPEANNYVYELTVDTVINNIFQYQENLMREWFRDHYASVDTIVEHLYFKKLVETPADTDSVKEGNSVKVRYIGRLMNGQVFDTNIEDTAKFYRLWSSSGSYEALSISYYKEDKDQFDSNNSVVKGFGQAVLHMNYGETAVALFNSSLGYGDSGSNPAIPEYSPLFFWLYIEPKN